MPKTRWVLILSVLMLLALCIQTYCQVHYLAPLCGCVLLLFVSTIVDNPVLVGLYGTTWRAGLLLLVGFDGGLAVRNARRLVNQRSRSDDFGAERAALVRHLESIQGPLSICSL